MFSPLYVKTTLRLDPFFLRVLLLCVNPVFGDLSCLYANCFHLVRIVWKSEQMDKLHTWLAVEIYGPQGKPIQF